MAGGVTVMNEPVEQLFSDSSELNLDPLWMPFTHNRYFKKHPRLVVEAKGVHYTTDDGRQLLDALSGLWCCNAGIGIRRLSKR